MVFTRKHRGFPWNEDVFSIKNVDITASYVSLPEGTFYKKSHEK